MLRALELAERGRGSTSPNPVVGAVLTAADGRVIGEGFHERHGGLHAEREAILAATEHGEDPTGGTMFVTLEPCSHQGKQPPCTTAIIERGISRLVYAAEDPTDKASGSGPALLRDAGIVVDRASEEAVGIAERQNQGFRKVAATSVPYVTYKAAMTLDGKVAAPGGDSRWISCPESRSLVHEMRTVCDAVSVGIGTALADDPLLTARAGDGSERSESRVVDKDEAALRVVFDRNARLPLRSALVESLDSAGLALVVSRKAPEERLSALERAGVTICRAEGESDEDLVTSGLAALAADFGVSDLLLEGGPHLAGSFFDAGQIDRMMLFVAPIVVGSGNAPSVLEGAQTRRIAEASRALSWNQTQVGDDILLDATLKEW